MPVRGVAHLARQEVHLGDGGRVSVQAGKFHTGCTVAESTGQGQKQVWEILLSENHSSGPQPGLPIQKPSKVQMGPLLEAALSYTPKTSPGSECRLRSAPASGCCCCDLYFLICKMG